MQIDPPLAEIYELFKTPTPPPRARLMTEECTDTPDRLNNFPNNLGSQKNYSDSVSNIQGSKFGERELKIRLKFIGYSNYEYVSIIVNQSTY